MVTRSLLASHGLPRRDPRRLRRALTSGKVLPQPTLLKGDQDSALSAWGHPAPPLHTRGRGAYPRAGSRQGLPKGLQLHLLVMAYEVGQGAVAVRVPRDQVAPVPLLVDDEVPTAVAAPVKASRCGQGRSSLGASTRRPHSPPCVPL